MDWFLRSLTDRVRESGNETLETALEFMFGLPLPRIGSDFFQSIYAQMWALALIVAMITTFVGIFRVLYSKQNDISPGGVATFVLRIWAVGFLLPPLAVGLLIVFETLNANLYLMWQDVASPELSLLQHLERFFGSVVNPVGLLMTWAGFFLSWVLLVMMVFFSFGVLLLLAGAPLLYALVALGKSGIGIWRWWFAWLIVAITAKSLVILVLISGIRFSIFLAEEGMQSIVTDITSLITLSFAVAIPFIMHRYIKRWKPLANVVMPLNASANTDKPIGAGTVAIATAGAGASLKHLYAQRGEQAPAKGRSSASAGLTAVASMVPHPAAKVFAGTSAFLSNSAQKARTNGRS